MFARGKRWMKEQLDKSRDFIDSIGKSAKGKRNVDLESSKLNMLRRSARWMKAHKMQLTVAAAGIFGAIWVSGCVVIAHQHYVGANTHEVFHVYIDGEKTGTVTDPEIVTSFLEKKREEIQEEYPNIHMDLTADAVTFESERGFKVSADNSAALDELAEKVAVVASGVELWIENERFAVVKDEETLQQILDRIESKFVPSKGEVSVLSANKNDNEPDTTLEKVEFVENIKVVPVETDPNAIMNEDEVLKLLEQGDTKPIQYEVQPGDCISCIAQKFNVTTAFVYEKNPWIEGEFIQIGDKLDLTVEQPALSVRTVEQYEEVRSIPFSTRYQDDADMRIGLYETIQHGQDGQKRVKKELVKVNGIVSEEHTVEEEIIKEPVEKIVKKGTKVVSGVGTGDFRWPVVSPRVTSGYGMRWGRLHKGIDMVSSNKNILAADNGKVSEAGYSDGYGNYIIINHGNGYKTLYGHLSKISVNKGDTVEKGDTIGVMGTTGHSTGVHLHFEIHKNGKAQDPDDYL